MGRYDEIVEYVTQARCGEIWGDMGRYGEILGRCGETRGGAPSLTKEFFAVNEVVVVARGSGRAFSASESAGYDSGILEMSTYERTYV